MAPYTSHDWLRPEYWTTPFNPAGLVPAHMPLAQASVRLINGHLRASLVVVTRSQGRWPHLSHHAITSQAAREVTVEELVGGLQWLTEHAYDLRPPATP